MPHSPRPRTVRVASRMFRALFVLAVCTASYAPAQTSDPAAITTGAVFGCVEDANILCLNHNRFAVVAGWQRTPSGPTMQASGAHITDETGYFWFQDPNNVELVVKVLNGCFEPFDSYWVFAAGLTNLGVSLEVTDTLTGESRIYNNPVGRPFESIQDTSALRTCP
jgi:hypothetical protein